MTDGREAARAVLRLEIEGRPTLALTLDRRRLRALAVLGAGLAAVALWGGALLLPRALAFPALLAENLTLRADLLEVQGRMDEVSPLVRRLRLYDAHLQAITLPPEGGPAELDVGAGPGLEDLDALAALEPLPDSPRPVEAWADAVGQRADAFFSLFVQAEPEIQRVTADMEELRLLGRALPSVWPTEGALSSDYGFRLNPMGRPRIRFHSGIDIANRRGTRVVAAARGRVADVGWAGGYGRRVVLEHGHGIRTVYAHCQGLRVREGQEVEAGELVATMGSTGWSTGPHLHFELRVDGHPIDPLRYLPRRAP